MEVLTNFIQNVKNVVRVWSFATKNAEQIRRTGKSEKAKDSNSQGS